MRDRRAKRSARLSDGPCACLRVPEERETSSGPKARGFSRHGHPRTPDEIQEEGETSEIAHLVGLLRSAGVTVKVEDGVLVAHGLHLEPGPGVFAAIETLQGREKLVQKVLGRGAGRASEAEELESRVKEGEG